MEREVGRERLLGLALPQLEGPSPWSPGARPEVCPFSTGPACFLPGVCDSHASPISSGPLESSGRFLEGPQHGGGPTGEGSALPGRNPTAFLGSARGWRGGPSDVALEPRGRRAPRRSTGLSEAEDWLGREAARPSGDSEGGLYKRQAVLKKRKPRPCGERRSSLDRTKAARPAPARDSALSRAPFFPAQPL